MSMSADRHRRRPRPRVQVRAQITAAELYREAPRNLKAMVAR